MRDTFVLLTAQEDAAGVQGRILALDEITGDEHFRYFTLGDCVFGVGTSGSVLQDYDEDELREIRERLGEFEPLLIEYQNMDCARALLGRCLADARGIVDTNYGDLLDYPEVLRRIRERPGWTLRQTGAG
ncbi:hypothetical protein LHJ74_09325 [Streptomyces sp. N2-109]|uniref:Uncharacterized protein n=1 Tax=Streptomyces gossypii TaxID=2883101 RepID=A0ABT2JS77_9ACTN|nr:hypothetical protein [Streptomyces gossypii]MCT2590109.1 hypothetical protein [Streptomyces gossypii]